MKYLNTASKFIPAGLESITTRQIRVTQLKRWLERDKFYLSCPDTLARDSRPENTPRGKRLEVILRLTLRLVSGALAPRSRRKKLTAWLSVATSAAIFQPAAQPQNCVVAPSQATVLQINSSRLPCFRPITVKVTGHASKPTCQSFFPRKCNCFRGYGFMFRATSLQDFWERRRPLAGKCGKDFALEVMWCMHSRFLITNSNFVEGLKTKVPKGKIFPDKLCIKYFYADCLRACIMARQ